MKLLGKRHPKFAVLCTQTKSKSSKDAESFENHKILVQTAPTPAMPALYAQIRHMSENLR